MNKKVIEYLERRASIDDAEARVLLEEVKKEKTYRLLRFYVENYREELTENLKLDDVDFICKYGYSDNWKEVFKEYKLNVKEIKKVIKEILENETI